MSLRGQIQEALRRFPRRAARRGARRGTQPTVTVVAVVTGQDGPAVLITRRIGSLRAHPGQYVLPTGRIHPGESVIDAALRELADGLGIWLAPESVLGLLDDYVTRSRYLVTPVVVWVGDLEQSPRSREADVAEVFAVPFDELDVEPVFVVVAESDHPVIRVPLRGGWVHAPTAAVLHQFREVILYRRRTRVSHFEQPVFAWR